MRKIGLPWHPELGIGAIASGGVQVLDLEAVRAYGVTREQLTETIAREEAELERRERAFRGNEGGCVRLCGDAGAVLRSRRLVP